MIGCLRTCVRKQPIIALFFEFETVLKFYNLVARLRRGILTTCFKSTSWYCEDTDKRLICTHGLCVTVTNCFCWWKWPITSSFVAKLQVCLCCGLFSIVCCFNPSHFYVLCQIELKLSVKYFGDLEVQDFTDSSSFPCHSFPNAWLEVMVIGMRTWWLEPWPGLQIRVRNYKLIFIFLNQNICCRY